MLRGKDLASVDQVVDAWKEIDARAATLSVRRANKLVEDAEDLVALAVNDEQGRRDLLRVIDTTPTFGLKDWLRSRVLPDIDLGLTDPEAFRAHPLVAFNTGEMPIRPSMALIDVKGSIKDRDLFEDEDEPGDFSWFAGRPTAAKGERWPTAADGLPYAHIIQVDLGYTALDFGATATIFDDLGVPNRGVLQLFHDLETYGWDAGDPRGWAVRWVQKPTTLLKRPAGLDRDAYRKPCPMQVLPAMSVPSPDSFSGSDSDWERYERVVMHIEDTLRSPFNQGKFKDDKRPTAWESGHESEAPTSRIGGFGYHAWNEELEELLAAALPLASADDAYFLLFDIAGVRYLEDWFGDCGHLQVWIRRSDLHRRQFGDVWCTIRTD